MHRYGEIMRPPNTTDYRLETITAHIVALINAGKANHVILLAYDWEAIVAR